jgi:hypothetical protein
MAAAIERIAANAATELINRMRRAQTELEETQGAVPSRPSSSLDRMDVDAAPTRAAAPVTAAAATAAADGIVLPIARTPLTSVLSHHDDIDLSPPRAAPVRLSAAAPCEAGDKLTEDSTTHADQHMADVHHTSDGAESSTSARSTPSAASSGDNGAVEVAGSSTLRDDNLDSHLPSSVDSNAASHSVSPRDALLDPLALAAPHVDASVDAAPASSDVHVSRAASPPAQAPRVPTPPAHDWDRIEVEIMAEHLRTSALAFMRQPGGKPDDLTLLVARVCRRDPPV